MDRLIHRRTQYIERGPETHAELENEPLDSSVKRRTAALLPSSRTNGSGHRAQRRKRQESRQATASGGRVAW